VAKKIDPRNETVAAVLHKWYSGYDIEKCPNGPQCGLMMSCREIAGKIINIVKRDSFEQTR
jgi:hypothetical protein